MNRDLIKTYLLRTKYTDISGYLVESSLINHRDKLLSDTSSYEKNFIRFIKDLEKVAVERKPLYSYIPEFPIMITNKKLWNELRDDLEVDKDPAYFVLDFFFQVAGFIVEIDSSLHDDSYDKARDIYLKATYGLDTIRLYEFGSDLDLCAIDQAQFKKRLRVSTDSGIRTHYPIDQCVGDRLDAYIVQNKEPLLFCDALLRYVGTNKFYDPNIFVISLTNQELMRIFPKMFKAPGGKFLENEIFLNKCSEILFNIYGKKLKKYK